MTGLTESSTASMAALLVEPQGHAPARACVEAKMARDALLVEISVVAAVK